MDDVEFFERACDNCATIHRAIDACVIGVLAVVLEDRGHRITEDHIASVNVEKFWHSIGGPAADQLADLMGLDAYPS